MSLSPSPPPPPRPPRRQFMFKRANLGAPDTTTTTTDSAPDTTSFFSRREENYTAPAVVIKKPKRSKKKDTGDGSPPKRARGNDGSEGSGDDHAQGSAKQRYDTIMLSDSDDGGPATTAGRKQRPKSKSKPRKREVSLTPPPVLYVEFPQDLSPIPVISRRPTTTSTASSSSLQPITLDSSDDEAPTPIPAPAISAEDALFATLEKRAREKAAATNTTSALSPPPPEPIVSVLITSHIEKTQPLVLRLRANQTLKAARTTWCQRQGFSADQAADIFLTWRGNKIFDHNSCRGMGIVENSDENVHLLAVTAEGYAEMERERERAYLRTEEDDIAEEEEKEEIVMRLTLRRKGVEDFKIKVRPDTKISKLIAAYRMTNKVPEEKEIRLDFDGDDLDPDQTVGDTELEDLFGIDVYIH